ncbi:hypothetical protein BDZ89DRAFT_1036444 [Hymenopellis radicata]|nr:hypothetical protein BDZ89DRAFT_1036444 [Hymenopellis radicata]
MDGLNLAIQESADEEFENASYNGWLHFHFVSSVIAFGAVGEIIACKMNVPGSWHDSHVARDIYERLRTQTPEGYYLVTDTTFLRSTDQIADRIRAPMKENTVVFRLTVPACLPTMQTSFRRVGKPLFAGIIWMPPYPTTGHILLETRRSSRGLHKAVSAANTTCWNQLDSICLSSTVEEWR